MKTVGEALAAELEARGVTAVFGIPGVHTIELYRGLARSGIRHITPRHEQGAGFMADGYARVSGRPGVALVITGPGLTNTLTPMAQARADSVPVLVVSGVNAAGTLGKGLGHLHELPDQQALAAQVALVSEHVDRPERLAPALAEAFAAMETGRPGPAHVQIPLDIAAEGWAGGAAADMPAPQPSDPALIAQAADRLAGAERPVILAGGGAKRAGAALGALAEALDAPVVQTVNARGLLFGHPLGVPASPSLAAVRRLIGEADAVLALGTELGPTDYDMYATGDMPRMAGLIRVDRDADQIARHPAEIGIEGDAGAMTGALCAALPERGARRGGAARAALARDGAWEEIGPGYRAQVQALGAIRDAMPGAIMVGDSTQPIYAGNLYYDHDRPGGWFNAATGYGALGYGIPAAIGAAVAEPGVRVISILGDGGAQFSLPEIMAAAEEGLAVTFLVWNNHGYLEIARAMEEEGVAVVGCTPAAPDFEAAAASFGIPYARSSTDPGELARSVAENARPDGPNMIEIVAGAFA